MISGGHLMSLKNNSFSRGIISCTLLFVQLPVDFRVDALECGVLANQPGVSIKIDYSVY